MLRLRDFEVRDFGMGFGAAKRQSRFSKGLSTLLSAQFTANGLRPHDLRAIANGPHFKQSLPRQEKAIF
jgi:hypothetical protein